MFVLQLDGSSFFFVTFENLRENLEPEGGFGIQLISNSTKGLFIYYVITDRGGAICRIYYNSSLEGGGSAKFIITC